MAVASCSCEKRFVAAGVIGDSRKATGRQRALAGPAHCPTAEGEATTALAATGVPAGQRGGADSGAEGGVGDEIGAAAAADRDAVPAVAHRYLHRRLTLSGQLGGLQRAEAGDVRGSVAAGQEDRGHGHLALAALVAARERAGMTPGAGGGIPQSLARAGAVGGDVARVVGMAAAGALVAAGKAKLALPSGQALGNAVLGIKKITRCWCERTKLMLVELDLWRLERFANG